MNGHLYKALRLIMILIITGNQSFAKGTGISVNFNTVTPVNNHFSFIAVVTSSASPVTYFWDFWRWQLFGLGNADIANHTYAVSGTYMVKLVAKNSLGESDSIIHAVTAHNYQSGTNADFSISPPVIYTGTTVQFTNTSTNTTGTATARWWDFGDWASASNVETPTHVYLEPGIYSIHLTADGPSDDTTVKSIRVLQGGVTANFSLSSDSICTGSVVQFMDASISNPGFIVSWHWQFGDGGTSNIQNPIHTYYGAADHTITLIVVNNTGQKDTVSHNIHVSYPTLSDFTYSPAIIYTGDSVQFIDRSVAVCGPIERWEWVCIGISANNDNFFWRAYDSLPELLVFPDTGKYQMILWAGGDTAIKTITVYPFERRGICAGGNAVFSVPVTGSTYKWQESSDNGISYQDLQDDPYYFSGSTNDTLMISHAPASWYGNLYRCYVDTIPAALFLLEFGNQYTGTGAWEEVGSWSCQSLPDANTDVIIEGGTVTINSNVICRTLKLMPGANIIVSPGYNLTIVH
jgi:PKD repeat protein